MMSKDTSDKAEQEQAYCLAVLASSQEELEALWSLFMRPEKEGLQMVTQKMNGFNHHYRQLQVTWADRYFAALETVY